LSALTYNGQFEADLKERVAAEGARVVEEILRAGLSIKTYDDYRYHVGYLAALARIDEFCADVALEIEKR